MEFVFLSDEWIKAAREIHDEFLDRIDAPDEALRMNVVVTGAPFDDPQVLGHIDTTQGSAIPQLGHLDEADVAVTIPYETAREMLVDQEYEALLIAFMSGEIEVTGDVTRLMELQEFDPSAEQYALGVEIAERLQQITA